MQQLSTILLFQKKAVNFNGFVEFEIDVEGRGYCADFNSMLFQYPGDHSKHSGRVYEFLWNFQRAVTCNLSILLVKHVYV